MTVASITAFYINASNQNQYKPALIFAMGCTTQSISLWNVAQ